MREHSVGLCILWDERAILRMKIVDRILVGSRNFQLKIDSVCQHEI